LRLPTKKDHVAVPTTSLMQATRESTCATALLDRLQFISAAIDKAVLVRLEPKIVDNKLLPLSLKISKYWKLAVSEVLRCKHPDCCTDHLSRGPNPGVRQPQTASMALPKNLVKVRISERIIDDQAHESRWLQSQNSRT
jgi:hypothetical protein